eukprot:m.266069 g.266069  ORF g.266069 m.266069 type:complete len:317 (+) comp40496_c1_seq7:26926-27876(+)
MRMIGGTRSETRVLQLQTRLSASKREMMEGVQGHIFKFRRGRKRKLRVDESSEKNSSEGSKSPCGVDDGSVDNRNDVKKTRTDVGEVTDTLEMKKEKVLKAEYADADDDDIDEDEDDSMDSDVLDDDDDDDDNDEDEDSPEEKPVESPELDNMPEFNEDTKVLIDAASKAADDHSAKDREKADRERDLSDVERELSVDLGPDEEFFPLQGHCYEFTEREYIYKLCPFEKMTQRSKHGGSETNLGTWGKWTGDTSKYDKMLYDNGEKCWNGPERSASVSVKCGIANELLSSSEPNRCEYAMDFLTPAACRHSGHDEL